MGAMSQPGKADCELCGLRGWDTCQCGCGTCQCGFTNEQEQRLHIRHTHGWDHLPSLADGAKPRRSQLPLRPRADTSTELPDACNLGSCQLAGCRSGAASRIHHSTGVFTPVEHAAFGDALETLAQGRPEGADVDGRRIYHNLIVRLTCHRSHCLHF